MPNCFKYSLIYTLRRNVSKFFELYQVFMHDLFVTNCLDENPGNEKRYSVKIKMDISKFHSLLECHTNRISSSLIFFQYFTFFKFNIRSQKSDNIVDKEAVLIRLKTKTICLTKRLCWLEKKLKNNLLDQKIFLNSY